VISASVANGQTASCWIAGNDKHFFTANPGTHTLSSYAVKQAHGTLQLQDATAGAATRPLDMGVSKDGRYLYALDSAQFAIVAFEIKGNGTLVPLAAAPSASIQTFAQGLAAR
jgi:6-phosphogluconolactonase (cycloisomerase 2 family)